jgi:peptidylprolyl isomerase
MRKRWNKNWKVKDGHNVKVHYVGTLTDGSEFDSSHSRGQTLDFQVGSGNLIKGFNDAIVGMKKGQVKKVTLSSNQAYGEINPEATTKVLKAAFPTDFEFQVGERVYGQSPNGQPMMAKITEVQESEVVLDLNHPLAGKDLTFEIELVDVEKEE